MEAIMTAAVLTALIWAGAWWLPGFYCGFVLGQIARDHGGATSLVCTYAAYLGSSKIPLVCAYRAHQVRKELEAIGAFGILETFLTGACLRAEERGADPSVTRDHYEAFLTWADRNWSTDWLSNAPLPPPPPGVE